MTSAMALRTSSLPVPDAPPPTPAEWRSRVEGAVAAAAAALAAGDVERLSAVYAELAGWDDPHRAFQARRDVTEQVLGFRPPAAEAWMRPFAAAAGALLTALERTPAEPTVLNHAGILLYELGELGGAEALFKAAHRLDPDLPHLDANLRETRLRKRAGVVRPKVALAAQLRPLAARARRVAAKARPAGGLSLSLCMIVKDEEEMLPGCLAPLAGAVDEMIVVDTGSTDRTAEIAESFGATVVHFPWTGSFAEARNVSIEHAHGDWIMYLDADEHMEAEDARALRRLLGRTWREGFYLAETNYTGGEEAGSAMTHMALRIWRNRPQYRFEGRIHEQKTQSMPTFLPERWEHTSIRVRHYGYLTQRIRGREKSRRNIELLEQEARENPSPFNDYNLARSLAIWSCRTCSASMPDAAM
jgi:tetratricopeptide (TPR) repeat protein